MKVEEEGPDMASIQQAQAATDIAATAATGEQPRASGGTPTGEQPRASGGTPTGDHARATDTPTGQDEAEIILEVLENMHIDSGKSPSKVFRVVSCTLYSTSPLPPTNTFSPSTGLNWHAEANCWLGAMNHLPRTGMLSKEPAAYPAFSDIVYSYPVPYPEVKIWYRTHCIPSVQY